MQDILEVRCTFLALICKMLDYYNISKVLSMEQDIHSAHHYYRMSKSLSTRARYPKCIHLTNDIQSTPHGHKTFYMHLTVSGYSKSTTFTGYPHHTPVI